MGWNRAEGNASRNTSRRIYFSTRKNSRRGLPVLPARSFRVIVRRYSPGLSLFRRGVRQNLTRCGPFPAFA